MQGPKAGAVAIKAVGGGQWAVGSGSRQWQWQWLG
jgi:hypothetical protein